MPSSSKVSQHQHHFMYLVLLLRLLCEPRLPFPSAGGHVALSPSWPLCHASCLLHRTGVSGSKDWAPHQTGTLRGWGWSSCSHCLLSAGRVQLLGTPVLPPTQWALSWEQGRVQTVIIINVGGDSAPGSFPPRGAKPQTGCQASQRPNPKI